MDEENAIVMRVGDEVHELRRADSDEYWGDDVYQALCAAIELYPSRSRMLDEAADNCATTESLQAFSQKLSTFDWADALSRASQTHVTPEEALYKLDSREVALRCPREALTVATVSDMYWPLIPAVLREVWDAAVQGRTVRLQAPPAFWEHRLSLPFKTTRDHSASN